MRILWLMTLLPWPPDTGGKQDTFFMLREFSLMGHEITSGIVFHDETPPAVPGEFSSLVKETHFLPGNPATLHVQLFKSITDTVPFKFRKYYSEQAVRQLSDILADGQFDVVLLDHLHLAPLLLDTRSIVDWEGIGFPLKVLRTQNVESTIVIKYAQRTTNAMVAAFGKKEAHKMKEYESNVLSEFDLVAAISPVDVATYGKMCKRRANIVSITAGVDIEHLEPSGAPPQAGEVVFVGSFDWQPNVDGAIWLINKVWPRVLEKYPDAHLSLVGRNPREPVKELASETVEVTGQVESVEEYVSRATCSVVPLWIGSGMRLKILEAFALGRPVVSTSLGAEGIEVIDGEHIIIRDDADQFADAVVKLLTDEQKCDELSRNARALAEKNYSWPNVAGKFSEVIEKLLQSRDESQA